MSLPFLLAIIVLAIVFIILATNYLKLHPFLALIIACFLVGAFTNMSGAEILVQIKDGFGSLISGIGIIIVLGSIIGVFMEKSGALDTLANFILQLAGSKRTVSAMGILGALVSIPVFCDSAFVILSRLSHSIARKQGIPSASLSLSLATGLYTSHTLIPPTPGPIAVAGNLGAGDQLGMVIIVGILISIPILFTAIFLSSFLGRKIEVESFELEDEPSDVSGNVLAAFLPILLPILLIAISSVLKILSMDSAASNFVGQPMIALLFGCLLVFIQARSRIKISEQGKFVAKAIEQAGPIILITGAGGAFGAVLKATPLTSLIENQFEVGQAGFTVLLLLAFGIAALLKTAQGSSTSALVIGSAILAPFVASIGLVSSFQIALMVSAFGAGAMIVSHANDSYFWVVSQLSGINMKNAYRSYTLITLAQGLVGLFIVLALSLLA